MDSPGDPPGDFQGTPPWTPTGNILGHPRGLGRGLGDCLVVCSGDNFGGHLKMIGNPEIIGGGWPKAGPINDFGGAAGVPPPQIIFK